MLNISSKKVYIYHQHRYDAHRCKAEKFIIFLKNAAPLLVESEFEVQFLYALFIFTTVGIDKSIENEFVGNYEIHCCIVHIYDRFEIGVIEMVEITH